MSSHDDLMDTGMYVYQANFNSRFCREFDCDYYQFADQFRRQSSIYCGYACSLMTVMQSSQCLFEKDYLTWELLQHVPS
jgi:hypothetical protein